MNAAETHLDPAEGLMPGWGAVSYRMDFATQFEFQMVSDASVFLKSKEEMMATYVLIHGAWHGRWCWYKVIPRLERLGHRILAPDLPGLGTDKTPVSKVSLKTWTESVCRILDAQPEPVVLVGHSRGGIVISAAGESRPNKVKTLVYLSAFLLQNGESLLQATQDDPDSLVLPNLIVREDQGCATVREEGVKSTFYGDCSDEDVSLAKLLLSPEPLAPLGTPIRTTEQNFGGIPRVYIECLNDRAITPAFQKKMYTALPCQKILSLNTHHSPFFSAPDELVTHLTSL